MSPFLSILLFSVATATEIETRFQQVHPVPKNPVAVERSPGQSRAVLLVPGLTFNPLNGVQPGRAEFHSWQKPGSLLLQELSRQADVFAFAYSQNTDLESISQAPGLGQAVNKLRFLGYQEIVLIGHSAGGVLARLFVEDHPQAPVSKVVQVCAPNLGSRWAQAEVGVLKAQEVFLQSLSKAQRQACCDRRTVKKIPQRVQFLCVVGSTGTLGDGLVSCPSQWPEDLQGQGIPALRIPTTHFTVMRSKKTTVLIADLVQQNHRRWSADEVRSARNSIFFAPAISPASRDP